MTFFFRMLTTAGGALLAASFFIPYSFHNSPVKRLIWAFDAMLEQQNGWTYLCEAIVIIYPYLWAATAACSIWFQGGRGRKVGFWCQILCHAGGGGAVTALGAALILSGDKGIAPGKQWTVALLPVAVLAIMLIGSRFLRVNRRIAFIAGIGFFLQAPLQLFLAAGVYADNGPVMGFVLGGCGALLGLAGAVCVFLIEGVHAESVRSHSDL